MNAFTKHKWRSQPDLGLGGSATGGVFDADRELHNLSTLSGVKFDYDVFKIIIDLLRLNVNPNTLLDVLRKMAMQSSMQREDTASRHSSQTLLPKDSDGASSVGSGGGGKREVGGSLGSLDTASIMSNYSYLSSTSFSKDKSRNSRSVSDM